MTASLTGRPWLQTWTGRAWCADAPEDYDYSIEELAHCLARIPRFVGHTLSPPYTVAQHSFLVAHEVKEAGHGLQLVKAALHHDAAEAFLQDLPHPVKMMPELEGYRVLCKRTEAAIAAHFGLDLFVGHPVIRRADLVLLATEKRDLMATEPHPWNELPLPRAHRIDVMSFEDAEALFEAMWARLQEKSS